MGFKQLFIACIVLFLYLCLGGLLFSSIENSPENVRWQRILTLYTNITQSNCVDMDMIEQLLKLNVNGQQLDYLKWAYITEDADVGAWNFFTSLFFSLVVISTVGFGSQSPSTRLGQLTCVIYAFVGIPIFLNAINQLSHQCKIFLMGIEHRLPKRFQKHHPTVVAVTVLIMFFFIYITPCLVIANFENWSFHTSLYFGFVTLSTIGFGDYVPGNRPDRPKWYKIFLGVWMIIGLTYVAILVSLLQTCLDMLVDRCPSLKKIHSEVSIAQPKTQKIIRIKTPNLTPLSTIRSNFNERSRTSINVLS